MIPDLSGIKVYVIEGGKSYQDSRKLNADSYISS
jgi:hypothetical protein